MNGRQTSRLGFTWLELLLALAAIALVLQLWPSLGRALWRALDIRDWSSKTWMILNAFVLMGLISARFVPHLYADWRQQQEHAVHNRLRQAEARARRQHREMIQRAKSARRKYY
jgi:hypothetical protein